MKTALTKKFFVFSVFAAMLLGLLLHPLTGSAREGGAAFVSQAAAVETSTIRGLLPDVSALVRGPASSYTLTIDSTNGEDVKALLADTRYHLIECYELSLTAINSQSITRNPQFGDVTITIPIGSSMDPGKGTFAIYTINTDGSLQRLSCEVIYGRSTGYAVRFLTIHFSTYAIVYTSGGSTRVSGTMKSSSGSAGITSLTGNGQDNSSDTYAGGNTGAASLDNGTTPGSGSNTDTQGSGTAADSQNNQNASSTTGNSSSAVSESYNGKGDDGKDPYYVNPKTGDHHHYGFIIASIGAAALLFLVLLLKRPSRSGKT